MVKFNPIKFIQGPTTHPGSKDYVLCYVHEGLQEYLRKYTNVYPPNPYKSYPSAVHQVHSEYTASNLVSFPGFAVAIAAPSTKVNKFSDSFFPFNCGEISSAHYSEKDSLKSPLNKSCFSIKNIPELPKISQRVLKNVQETEIQLRATYK